MEPKETEDENNVIRFPSSYEPPISIKDVKIEYNEEAVEFVYENVLSMLGTCGFNTFSSKSQEKDLIFIYEAIKSYMDRYHGLDNPIHELVERIFEEEETEDNDNL